MTTSDVWPCPICRGDGTLFREAADSSWEGNQSVVIAWSLRCGRCGDYHISDADRALLLGNAIVASDVAAYPYDRLHLVSGYLRERTIAGCGL